MRDVRVGLMPSGAECEGGWVYGVGVFHRCLCCFIVSGHDRQAFQGTLLFPLLNGILLGYKDRHEKVTYRCI